MLYILPPPSAPSPPSPWNSILCAAGGGQGGSSQTTPSGASFPSGTGSSSVHNVITKGTITSWGIVESSDKRPPFKVRQQNGKIRAMFNIKDSGTGGIPGDDDDSAKGGKSLSECYFAGKGAALVLPPHERIRPNRRVSAAGSDIQQHLQSMFYLLRPEETLKMAVKLESAHAGRTRYLVVVSCVGRQDAEESCLLGIDCNERTTVGLVLRVLADTAITLDGDGGFSVSVCGRQHIFKPVSVQAMWSALQTLHKVSSKAREQNYFLGGLTHDWVTYYEQHIESDRSCLNEWHAMDSLESRRPPSPDSLRTKPRERDETEQVIRTTLKEIMMSVDLDEVTSKYIRSRLEEDLDMDLGEFKSFIDQEMLTILGQMDAPTEIFEHVYLGSEWNASNLEELQKNGVHHILNVTREIDNFFPGMFDYLNIRVYDDEKTDLLKHWDDTFKYITRAKKEGSKVLVHCKMGVSRSASVVIAYAMKAYNWDFNKAMKHVKEKRTCIKPNTNFLAQLETYQGILDAMKNKEKLQRSKSETNLKSPGFAAKTERIVPGSEPTPMIQALQRSAIQTTMSGQDLRQLGGRPKSWSPDSREASNILPSNSVPTSVSLEHLSKASSKVTFTLKSNKTLDTPACGAPTASPATDEIENRNILIPCENGQVYSVSQNQIVHLPGSCKVSNDVSESSSVPSVKHRVIELESQTCTVKNELKQPDKKGLVLNLTSQFENSSSKPPSPVSEESDLHDGENIPSNTIEESATLQIKVVPHMLTAVLVKKEIWDPGEKEITTVSYCDGGINSVSYKTCDLNLSSCSNSLPSDSLVWTSSSHIIERCSPEYCNVKDNSEINLKNNVNNNDASKQIIANNKSVLKVLVNNGSQTLCKKEGDPFSNQLDKVFDREERKQQKQSLLVNIGIPPLPQSITELSNEETIRDCPSRQSSWSSYDSAVVLGYQGELRDTPSRHSSWGSGDTRTLPSRNSSWGSYDMKPNCVAMQCTTNEFSEKQSSQTTEDLFGTSSSGMFAYDKNDIPSWYPGTVKRTKQKLEEGNGKRVCSEAKQLENNFVDEINNSIQDSCLDSIPTSGPALNSSENNEIVEAYNIAILNNSSISQQLHNIETDSEICNTVPLSNLLNNTEPNSLNITGTKGIDISRKTLPKLNILSDSKRETETLLSVSAPENSSIPMIDIKNKPLSSSVSDLTILKRNSKPSGKNHNTNNTLSSFVKQHKLNLENINKNENISKQCISVDESESDSKSSVGIVKNLKREFEAKNSTKLDKSVEISSSIDTDVCYPKNKVRSLPSSPVSVHADLQQDSSSPEQETIVEDLSVKKLVGKYEVSSTAIEIKNNSVSNRDMHICNRPKESLDKKSLNSEKSSKDMKKIALPVTKSSLLDRNMKNSCDPEFKRPPVPPTVVKNTVPMVLASVVTSAAHKKQQQHGKTHPLSRLAINKQRHNNPVYNTM